MRATPFGGACQQWPAQARRQRRCRPARDVVGGQPGQSLRRPIEHRHPPRRIDGHHAALDRGHDVLDVLVRQHDLRVEPRVLDGDSRLVRQRHQQVEVLRVKRIAGELRPDRDERDQPVVRDDGEQQRPVAVHEIVVQPPIRIGHDLPRHFLGDHGVLHPHQRLDDRRRRGLGRSKRARLATSLRHRPPEAVVVLEIDGDALDAGRFDYGRADERQQTLEIQHSR